MSKKRKSISKKIRFEVFKRDSFTCQYCGKKAPDVVLEIDHIEPVSKGGTNELMNLVTSCFDCNRGKSDRALDDNSVLNKQREQLEEINERMQQLEMMKQWKSEMSVLKETELEILISEIEECGYCTLNERGIDQAKKWIKKYNLSLLLECVERAFLQYDDVEKAISMIPRIANIKSRPDSEKMQELFIIRAIARNRCGYFNDQQAISLLKKASEKAESEALREIALTCKHWTNFREELEEIIRERG